MPVSDDSTVLHNLWLAVAISLSGGGFAGQIAGVVHGDLGILPKLVIGVGAALVIFGTLYFFGATASGV